MIIATSSIKRYETFNAILKKLINIRGETLFLKYRSEWVTRENALGDAYISALQTFPADFFKTAKKEHGFHKRHIDAWQHMVVKSLPVMLKEMEGTGKGTGRRKNQ